MRVSNSLNRPAKYAFWIERVMHVGMVIARKFRAFGKQKNYYFRIYMHFSLDNTGDCIVNVREVVLHPYKIHLLKKKGGGAGISSFSFQWAIH